VLSRADALSVDRRTFLVKSASAVPFLEASLSFAADDDTTTASFQLQVTVTIPSNVDQTEILGPDTALYVTARPADATNVPSEVLVAGRVPPVLTARFPKGADLGSAVILTQADVTPEGKFWEGWKAGALVVSARLDTDGVASTRSPTDLVGRAVASAGATRVTLPLQGRGLTGKFLTGG